MNRSSGEGGGMGDVVRILVADDHPLTRDGIKAALALDAEFEVVGEASDGQEAVHLAEEVKPDVVLMDVRMPVLGGIRATQTISRTVPNARVVMLTVEETQARVGEAIQAGAAGYLLKDIDAHELARAVHLPAGGSAVTPPTLPRQFIEEIRQLTRGEQSVSTLSAREVEVLQMIAYGSTNREVAEALHISPQTVKTYLERIFTKLGVSDRTRAVAVVLLPARAALLGIARPNARLAGVPLLALGLLLNLIVVLANLGMPVPAETLERAGIAVEQPAPDRPDAKHVLERGGTRLALLGDRLAVRPLRTVTAFGTVIELAGLFLLLQYLAP